MLPRKNPTISRSSTGAQSPARNGSNQSFDPPPPYECNYSDVESIQSITASFLLTLGTACVEKTLVDPFNSPGSVLSDVQKDLIEYINNHTDSYAAGRSSAKNSSFGPVRIIEDLLESFIISRRTIFHRVSSKLLNSERKEDRIDEFVAEIDRNGVWSAGKREILAKSVLKKMDRERMFHCDKTFSTAEDLTDHKLSCMLRPMACNIEGCSSVFSALRAQDHEQNCLFKILPCRQKCNAKVRRGDMDMHCSSNCPMKMVACPFSDVGCSENMPQGDLDQHHQEFTQTHLQFMLRMLQKQELSMGNQIQRIALLEKVISIAQKSDCADVSFMNATIRDQENKIRALEQEVLKLQRDVKATDVSAEVLQLRRELRNLQKQVQSQCLGSSGNN